jgi:hypothetical protein
MMLGVRSSGPSSRRGDVSVRTAVAALLLGGISLSVGTPDARGAAPNVNAAVPAQVTSATFTGVVPKPNCRAKDRPETGLQGEIPAADRATGRAAQGYTCNVDVISQVGSALGDKTMQELAGWAAMDSYKHCAYYQVGDDLLDGIGPAFTPDKHYTAVVDVSNPASPRITARLRTPAATASWESIRVHAGRGLLMMNNDGRHAFDIYDISKDCTKPKLLSSTSLPTAVGHEGWVTPDGRTFWFSSTSLENSSLKETVTPVDISNPRAPKEIPVGNALPYSHGGSSSNDGRRAYFCDNSTVHILDTTGVQRRDRRPVARLVKSIALPGTTACQRTYPLTYRGKPFLLQFGELGDEGPLWRNCSATTTSTFSRPHIFDLQDESSPKLVATLMNEVALPKNCRAISKTAFTAAHPLAAVIYGIFTYGTHMCSPDRLDNPRLLACAEAFSGVRVYNIADPYKPREVAYYNPGTPVSGGTTGDIVAARPILKYQDHEIWFNSLYGGFHVLRLADSVFAGLKGDSCTGSGVYYFKQYNPQACANSRGPVTVAVPATRAAAGGSSSAPGGRSLASTGLDLGNWQLAGALMVMMVSLLALRTRATPGAERPAPAPPCLQIPPPQPSRLPRVGWMQSLRRRIGRRS